MQYSRSIILLTAFAGLATSADSDRPDLNASRLRTGSLRYRTLVGGKDEGQSLIQIRKSSGNYVFSNLITGAFSQSWEAVASQEFKPVSAKLLRGEGNDARPAFELAYSDEDARAHVTSKFLG
jgi:hypothetical protein